MPTIAMILKNQNLHTVSRHNVQYIAVSVIDVYKYHIVKKKTMIW